MSPSDGAVPPSADRGPSRARLATWFGVGALRVWLCRINGLQHWPGVGRWGEAKWTGGHRSGPFPVLTPTRNQLQCRPPPPEEGMAQHLLRPTNTTPTPVFTCPQGTRDPGQRTLGSCR